ncbi:MAG: hypothetical protein KDC98_25510, partial [Planctomycetes bacterium]|nr:hypothetical protein [Planctomycetota bacterium]
DNRFADELSHARAALQAAGGSDIAAVDIARPCDDPLQVEAMRWIGDAAARQFGSVLAEDPAAAAGLITEGLRAFAEVVVSDFGHDKDWSGFASFCGAIGLWRQQFLAAQAGVRRLPGGANVRQCLDQALWSGGRSAAVGAIADGLVEELDRDHPALGDARWYAGYAWMLRAEQQRRARHEDAAVLSYGEAAQRFAAAAAARPDYKASCDWQTALCWLGIGLAQVQAGRRAEAAAALVTAVGFHGQLASARDGLGYDVLDLVDKICEWRADGSSPVDPLELFARLDALAPDTPFWAVALADSQLREALRADGRNPERAMRDTVDAGGEPIRMLLGLPNAEGDEYLRRSLQLLRAVADRLETAEDKKALAQSATIQAERNLERDILDGVHAALTTAAAMLDRDPPPEAADAAMLRTVAATFRAELGEARPRWRNGR